MIKEFDSIILTCDLPTIGLRAGDLGTIVMVHEHGKGFEVEFCALDGETIAVATVSREQVRPIAEGEIANARRVDRSTSAA